MLCQEIIMNLSVACGSFRWLVGLFGRRRWSICSLQINLFKYSFHSFKLKDCLCNLKTFCSWSSVQKESREKNHFSCAAHVKLNHCSGFPNKHWHAAMKMSWMKTINMHTCIKCYKTSFGKEQLSGDTVACTCAVRFKSCPAGISSTVLTLRLSAETRLAWLYPW